MAFTRYIPDTAQWTEYFIKQVENRSTSRKDIHAAQLGGGVAVQDESVTLTRVGPIKSSASDRKHTVEPVKVVITSPAETTVEQAASELKHMEETQGQDLSRQRTVKRKTPLKSGRSSTNSKKKKTTKKHQDIFSK